MVLVASADWLQTDWILSQFGKRRTVAKQRYAKFVAEGKNLSPWSAVRGQVVLGNDAFVEKLHALLKDKGKLKEIPRTQRLLHRPGLKALFTKRVQSEKALRDDAIRKAYLDYGYTMAAIARYVGLHYSTVSKVIKGER